MKKRIKRLLSMVLLTMVAMCLSAQEKSYIHKYELAKKLYVGTYTQIEGFLFKNSDNDKFYKFRDYFVPAEAFPDKGSVEDRYYNMPFFLQTRPKYWTYDKDTLIIAVGSGTEILRDVTEKFEDSERVYYLYYRFTEPEVYEYLLSHTGDVPSLTTLDLKKGVRPCQIQGPVGKSYYNVGYLTTPKDVLRYMSTLDESKVIITPFYVRFNYRNKLWKVSIYDWNLMHQEELPAFRFKTFNINNILEISVNESALCFKVELAGNLHFFKNITELLKANGYKVSKYAIEDMKELLNSLPVSYKELRPVGPIAQYYKDFISSGRGYILYK